jgi:hypothetical protein
MRNIFILILFSSSITFLKGQYISSVYIPDTLQTVTIDSANAGFKIAQQITAEDFKKHLYVLASDSYEGREAGQPGIEKAADYISGHLEALDYPKIGVENSFYQNIGFRYSSWKTNEMFVNGNRYKHLWDYLAFQSRNSALPSFTTDELVFLGFGIDDPNYSDYKKNKVKDKVILIYNGEPIDKNGISQVTETAAVSDWDLDKKLRTAKAHGVKLVMVIEEDIKKMLMENRRLVLGNSTTIITEDNMVNPYANSIHISTTIANDLIGDKLKKVTKSRDRSRKKGKARDIKLKANLNVNQDIDNNELLGKNIMAYIEGTDKKDELVVVTAHYDHVGKKGDVVFNGADDNGTGTTSLLEMTDAYMIAKKNGISPRRSILFMWVTAEEKGLLGSQYYSENPVFALENTVANVNVDMIGRSDEKYQGRSDYIYVIGSDRLSTDLHKINETINEDYSRITMDYTFNSETDPNRFYYRSDHYNFARKGIPAIFFFSGVHEDYHQPGDTPDKIDYVKSERIARHISQLVWELANREDRIVVDGEVR